jgi:hypothetical protein
VAALSRAADSPPRADIVAMKRLRHFLCGLLCGAAGMYWYTFDEGKTFEKAVFWLESAADEYRATHDTPKADSGWGRYKKKEEKNRL